MNIENTLIQGKSILKANNISNPSLDSEILLSESINEDKKYIILNSKKTINNKQLINFTSFIDRRKNGEPIAYLTKKKRILEI
jgi:release factor glutamine methyltransferase